MRKSINQSLLGCLLALAFANGAVAEPRIIFLVRHAERADAGGPAQADPELSAAGRERAAALARELKDCGIRAIFTSEFKRTRQTAAPLAESLGRRAEVVPTKDAATIVARLRNASGNVLVVGHSNTISEIIRALGWPRRLQLGKRITTIFLLLSSRNPRNCSISTIVRRR
jgi:broad specificity phosphatase PhoE